MAFFLLLALMLALVIAYFLNGEEIISPSVLFTSGFVLMTFFALLNLKKWSLNVDINTFLVLVGGVAEFTVVCWLISKIRNNSTQEVKSRLNVPTLNKAKLTILCIVVFINFLIIVAEIRKITGISNPIKAGNYLNYASRQLNNTIRLSGRASLLSIITLSIGVWSEWQFLLNLILLKRFNWRLFFIIVIALITPLMTGVRGGTFTGIITIFIFLFFTLQLKNNSAKVNFKYTIIALLCIMIILVALPLTATMVGRDVSSYSTFDYVSIYLGAQLKNLSIFIQNNSFPINIGVFGAYTFYSIIPSFAKVFHLNIPQYLPYLPFQYKNGYNLGNVYTVFYPWLYDFGYAGIIIMTFVMAFIAQFIYSQAKLQLKKGKLTSILILLYGYLGSFVFLAFFADGFIRAIGINLVYMIITWYILNILFFDKFKLRKSK